MYCISITQTHIVQYFFDLKIFQNKNISIEVVHYMYHILRILLY